MRTLGLGASTTTPMANRNPTAKYPGPSAPTRERMLAGCLRRTTDPVLRMCGPLSTPRNIAWDTGQK